MHRRFVAITLPARTRVRWVLGGNSPLGIGSGDVSFVQAEAAARRQERQSQLHQLGFQPGPPKFDLSGGHMVCDLWRALSRLAVSRPGSRGARFGRIAVVVYRLHNDSELAAGFSYTYAVTPRYVPRSTTTASLGESCPMTRSLSVQDRGQRMRRRGVLFALTTTVLASFVCASASASIRVTLGSSSLARVSGTRGLGAAHPRLFDAGGFPVFDELEWKHWGDRTATASGFNVPDGPYPPERVEVRAYDRGACDQQRYVYRHVELRYVTRRQDGWTAFSPYTVGAAARGTLCLDAVVHHCTVVAPNGSRTSLTAYNISCRLANGYWLRLPRTWSGANGDDARGGHAWLYPTADATTVINAGQPNGLLSLRQLAGTPAIYAHVVYGE
jgi:hypothetical protein